ncbi:hypothetical protein LXA43DRAFT_50494 [Ganoderma leucocontextum]|nr:hypothetical protein LXA43DRAFT_50494 [Ganoderma leucocontextum]
MGTCRLLYALGPPYVLRHGVTLRTRLQMASFVCFMRADAGRLAYMRSLDICAKVFEPRRDVVVHGTDASFADLLTHPTTALNTLILHDAEKILACNPELLTAVSTLTSVKQLHVDGVGRAAIVTLRTMRSHLVSATVALAGPLGYTPALRGHSAFSDVFSVLQFSADTLQELDLSLGIPINPARDIPVPLQFPHVRTLRTVLDTHFPQCILLRLFPNLQNLHLIPGLDLLYIVEDPNSGWFMHALRDANGRIGLSSSPRLVECSGEVSSLYPLSAHLTVSKLRICSHLHDRELPFFRIVLVETRPAELEVSVRGLDVVEAVAGILRELEPLTLRVLTLNVSFRPWDGEQVAVEERLYAALGILLQMSSSLNVVVSIPSTSRGLTVGNCFPNEDGVHAVLASSSKVFGASLTNAQRREWRIVRHAA